MTTSFFRISARGDSSAYGGKTRLFRRGAFEGEDMTSVNCLMFTLISINKINQKIFKNIQSDVEEEFAKRNISIDDEHYIKYLEDKYPHYRKDILEEWKSDYQAMMESMIYGKKPSFEELLDALSELQERFRISK